MRASAGNAQPGCNSSECWQRQCKPCKREPPTAQPAPMWNRHCFGPFGKERPSLCRRRWRTSFTPIAMRLSRFFEVGAYVAVGAAIVVALFLGVRCWSGARQMLPVKSRWHSQVSPCPALLPATLSLRRARSYPWCCEALLKGFPPRRGESASQSSPDMAEPSQTSTDADYVALMFCDPLSCSGDAQVVRMELPGSGPSASGGEQDAQMRIADVVVGYDGVVRAVRIVN